MGVIYKITSPSGKLYVGKTKSLRKRIAYYKWCAAKKTSSIIILNSIKKYGWDKHILEVVEEIDDNLLNEREIYWIKELKTYSLDNPKGMNMTFGGDGNKGSWMHRLDLREKQSKRFTGEGNPFFGKTHSEEFKANKSKEVSEYNKRNNVQIPKWGAEKGRLKVIKSVVCYDKFGCFLKQYDSLTDAANQLNVNRSSVTESCNDIITAVEGKYIFRYFTEKYPLKISIRDIKIKTVKRPIIYFLNNFQIEYPSALEASLDLKIPKTTINRAAFYNKLKPIRGGHIFIYKDLYKNIMQEVA
jgi:group I intron endonuclease